MKRIAALVLIAALSAAAMTGCGSGYSLGSSAAPASQAGSAAPSSAPAASGTVKTGLGVVSSIAKSTDVKDGKGLAEADTTIAAVTVGQDGKIVKCDIDGAQTKVNFSDKGKITTPLDTKFKTKDELGTEYGLKKQSKLGKEWNEQAEAFAQYVIGKTVDEIKGIAVDGEGHATGSDLTASVTISIGDFVDAIEKAVANAKDLGAKADDKLGVGTVTDIADSKDAAGSEDGLAQAYSYYAAITVGADGKITSSVLDASQTKINFSAVGKVTSDLKAEQKTKVELGDAYGMKKQSKLGKEWYEEAEAFAKYVVGKTPDEVKGIAVDSEGHATDSELTASVTVSVGSFIEGIQKAAAAAK